MTDLDRSFLRELLDAVDTALEAGNVAEAMLAAQDVRDYVNHEDRYARGACRTCGSQYVCPCEGRYAHA